MLFHTKKTQTRNDMWIWKVLCWVGENTEEYIHYEVLKQVKFLMGKKIGTMVAFVESGQEIPGK